MWPVARSCGERYSRPMSALLTIQEEIVKEIATTLHLTRNREDETPDRTALPGEH